MTNGAEHDKAAFDLEWKTLVDRIAGRCVSDPGVARVRALAPAPTLDEARARAALSRDALKLFADGARLPVIALPDLSELLGRLDRGSVASGPELAELRRMLDGAKALRAFVAVHGAEHPALAAALATDRTLDRLRDEIAEAVGEDGEVLDRASPALARARKKVSENRRELASRLSELMTRYADVLRDRFYTEREGRYVLPVRADAPFRVDGIVFGSSSSGGTLYVEPKEVTEISNRRYVAEAEVEREVARVLGAISISARSHVEALRVACEAEIVADVLTALSSWADAVSACVLEPIEERVLDLRTMRHPLLEDGETEVVASDLRLDGAHGLVISGPNAGGKTVALKCLGLAVWMVRSGIAVPADSESRVGFFDLVLTDIGDEQSLARSLSTFSAHAARLASYLAAARPGALVLLDEVAAGTDPDEGAALAAAVLESLVGAGAAVAVTTHYERLKQLAAHDSRFENGSVGFDFDAMRPTFRVTLGVPGASSALTVASRYGIPKDVIARAEALIPEDKLKRETLLAEIEADRARAATERRDAEAAALEQERLRAALDDEVRRAREQERARLAREGNELTAAVRDARAKLRNATERLQKGDVGRAELRELEKVVSAAGSEVAVGSKLETTLRTNPTGAGAPIATEVRLAPGDTVYVPKLRAHAEVLEAPSRGQIRVAAGAMKLTLRLDEIGQSAPGAGSVRSAAKKPRAAAPPARHDETPVRTDSITCDVRGMRAAEAIDRVEAFIDRLLSEGDPAGFILHGHGTNALKNAIREHVSGHRFVAKSRPGEADEGGGRVHRRLDGGVSATSFEIGPHASHIVMRSLTDANSVTRFMRALGERTRSSGNVYLTGGATAVLYGWRATTVDIDLKLDPEPEAAFEAIAELKDELDVNVELAAPDQFIPPLPGWRERSVFIGKYGIVDFFHYDPVSQALAKIERSHARDISDVNEMIARGLVERGALLSHFERIKPTLNRYPSIDADVFEQKVRAVVDVEK